MSRTYGKLRHSPACDQQPGFFAVRAEPHVMMRLKRVFPRAQQARSGILILTDTPEAARDLEWVLTRWPLEQDHDAAVALKTRADTHRKVEADVAHVLTGGQGRLALCRTPARAARPYQQTAADLLLTTRQLLVADEVGLGKTQTAVLAMLDPDALPAVVVCLTHLPAQWCREVKTVAPWLTTHVARSTRPYDVEADVLIIPYSKLAGWADHLAAAPLGLVVFDEIQELRRDGTYKYNAAGRIADRARYRCGLSATPVYNYGGEAHNIFSILAPGVLGSRTEFVREWGGSERQANQVTVADPNALGTYLRDQGVMLRRTRADVGRELPDVVRVTHTVDADPSRLEEVAVEVEALARTLLAGPRKERFAAAGEMDWKLRQATGLAKAPYVAAFVRMLLDSEPAVVLFGWHREVYERWERHLAEFRPRLYTGTESPAQKEASVKAFLDGDCRVLMVSLRAGAGLDGLQKRARVAVFGELDWSPGVHFQCEGRLNRDGQADPVVSYFLTCDSGSDPTVSEVLGLKRGQSEPMLDPDVKPLATADGSADRMQRLAAAFLARRETPPEAPQAHPRVFGGAA